MTNFFIAGLDVRNYTGNIEVSLGDCMVIAYYEIMRFLACQLFYSALGDVDIVFARLMLAQPHKLSHHGVSLVCPAILLELQSYVSFLTPSLV